MTCRIITVTQFLLTRPLRDVTIRGRRIHFRFRISTHTPLAGRDKVGFDGYNDVQTFLLTRPLRDVTRLSNS